MMLDSQTLAHVCAAMLLAASAGVAGYYLLVASAHRSSGWPWALFWIASGIFMAGFTYADLRFGFFMVGCAAHKAGTQLLQGWVFKSIGPRAHNEYSRLYVEKTSRADYFVSVLASTLIRSFPGVLLIFSLPIRSRFTGWG